VDSVYQLNVKSYVYYVQLNHIPRCSNLYNKTSAIGDQIVCFCWWEKNGLCM